MRLETKEISAITSAIREYDPQVQISRSNAQIAENQN
jgi:hypothetical protein